MNVAECQKIKLYLYIEEAVPLRFNCRLVEKKYVNLQGVFDLAGDDILQNFEQIL